MATRYKNSLELGSMEWALGLLIGAFLLMTAAACRGPDVPPAEYPAEIVGIGDSTTHPLSVAGFERAKILTYASDITDISVEYKYLTPDAQIIATVYFYDKGNLSPHLDEHFLAVKAEIERIRPRAVLLVEETIVLEKKGQRYPALRAMYRYRDAFINGRQDLYSIALVWSYKDKYMKLRSTSPISQRVVNEQKSMELLSGIDWAYLDP